MKKTLQSLKKDWGKIYDFNLQLFNDEFNLYIEKNGVDLESFGGYQTESEVVEVAENYLNRVNPKK